MRPLSYLLSTVIASVLAIAPLPAFALTDKEVDAVASQTTVVVAQGLQKGDIEARQEFNPGSGVLIGRNGKTYYVLTALHVVRTRGVMYGVRTSDGEVHFVDDIKTKDRVILFGKETGQSRAIGAKIDGFDLALVKFESDRDYPIAPIGDAKPLQLEEALYTSGWPHPEQDSAQMQRVSSSGKLRQIANSPFTDGGYSLLYSNDTRRGMSGGPVFDSDGKVVGIHGRGRGQGQDYCVDPNLSPMNSCGMQALHFITQAEASRIQLAFNRQPVDSALIARGIANKPRADRIDDIYKDFTRDFTRGALRDIPSGGCGSLLLGESCDKDGNKGLNKGQKVVYKPPKNLGIPRQTIGALSRSGDCQGIQCLIPLLPMDAEGKLSHFPLTVSDRPTFFINVPVTSGNVIFTLYRASASGDLERRVFRTIFPIACTSAGIFRFNLPPNSPPLDVDRNYAWEFALGENRSKGLVRRVELNSSTIGQIRQMNLLERAATYANAGIWFESLESLAELRASQPNNSDANTGWKELLKDNELKEIAEQPIAKCK